MNVMYRGCEKRQCETQGLNKNSKNCVNQDPVAERDTIDCKPRPTVSQKLPGFNQSDLRMYTT